MASLPSSPVSLQSSVHLLESRILSLESKLETILSINRDTLLAVTRHRQDITPPSSVVGSEDGHYHQKLSSGEVSKKTNATVTSQSNPPASLLGAIADKWTQAIELLPSDTKSSSVVSLLHSTNLTKEDKKFPSVTTEEIITEELREIVVDARDSHLVSVVEEIVPKDEPNSALAAEVLASHILDIIGKFGQHISDGEEGQKWAGKSMFLAKVADQVRAGGAIQMILPAFPWKSINTVDKVTGSLPDQGEKLALGRLNQMCDEIRKVYPPGGCVNLATDGLLFDDVVGISDEDTWAYSVELMKMAKENDFTSINLLRAMDIIGLSTPGSLTKETYLALVGPTRALILEKYGKTESDVRSMMETDSDTLLTYRGFIRFLESDLKHSPRAKESKSGHAFRRMVKSVALQMMIRAESFTALLKEHCGSYVRLSIHPSSGTVKLSIPLIPQANGSFPKSPWHSSIALGLDGSCTTVHAKDVRDSHNLIFDGNRPLYFREKSPIWDWNDDRILIEPLHDGTLLVRPVQSSACVDIALGQVELEHLDRLKAAYKGRVRVLGIMNSK